MMMIEDREYYLVFFILIGLLIFYYKKYQLHEYNESEHENEENNHFDN